MYVILLQVDSCGCFCIEVGGFAYDQTLSKAIFYCQSTPDIDGDDDDGYM